MCQGGQIVLARHRMEATFTRVPLEMARLTVKVDINLQTGIIMWVNLKMA